MLALIKEKRGSEVSAMTSEALNFAIFAYGELYAQSPKRDIMRFLFESSCMNDTLPEAPYIPQMLSDSMFKPSQAC